MILYSNPKIVCVGLPKTGTTSVDIALHVLGYRIAMWNNVYADLALAQQWHKLWRVLDRYDGCRDMPWCCLYKQIHMAFPKSKFILTVRSPDPWIKSILKHFDPSPENPRQDHRDGAKFREQIFGHKYPKENPQGYLKNLQKHNKEVLDYFGDRLLVMDLEKGDGWAKLCEFLGKSAPDQPFPHANRASEYEDVVPCGGL